MAKVITNIVGSVLVGALAFGGGASAAGYLKIGDIKGEATAADGHKDWINLESFSFGPSRAGAPADHEAEITLGQDPQAAALLLPAVQKAREAASRSASASGPRRHPVATYREVSDEGKVLKTYWLRDVVLTPGEGGAMKVAYSCKTWRDEATGTTGGDCDDAAPARKKGKVEYNWKVEEGRK